MGIAAIAAAAWFLLRPPADAPALTVHPALQPASVAPAPAPEPPPGELRISVPNEGNGAGVVISTPSGVAIGSQATTITAVGAPGPIVLSPLPDPALIEAGDYGPLPRIDELGRRPVDVYARPVDAARVGSRPQIAIVVGGIGINASGTERALAQLPGEISLAFAPYGDNLGNWTARARTAGHELLLQIPLEPFDYPINNPGQQTLTVYASDATNRDRLEWLLARMTTYAGVVGYAGGRFTADVDAMEPMINEIADRGLMYLDDGTSARSRSADVASGVAPYAKADLVIDTVQQPAAINARLSELEAIARERGFAIGSASAYPETVAGIAAWAEALSDRGFVLVPVTALINDPYVPDDAVVIGIQ